MRPMIGAIAVGAIAIGGAVVLATSRHSSNAQAYQSTAPLETAVPAPVVAPTTMAAAPALATQTAVARPVRADVVVGNTKSYGTAPRPRAVVHKRSTKKSVAIIGGSTVGGAIVGGLLGGKKGAVIGGVVAGTAGTVYDRKTRKKVRVE